MRVLSVETIREDCCEPFTWNHTQYQSCIWREQIEVKSEATIESTIESTEANIIATHPNGEPAILNQQRYTYIGTLTDRQFLLDFFQQQCQELGIKTYTGVKIFVSVSAVILCLLLTILSNNRPYP